MAAGAVFVAVPFAVLVLFFEPFGLDMTCNRTHERAVFLGATAVLLGAIWWLSERSAVAAAAVVATAATAVVAVADRGVAEALVDPVIVGPPAALALLASVALLVIVRGLPVRAGVLAAGWAATWFGVPVLFVFLAACSDYLA